jgi:hypothetical protein
MPDLVNVNGAARILGTTPQFVHRLAEADQLPGAKIGSGWFFRRSVVERLRDQRNS